jgi:hypothetical protein
MHDQSVFLFSAFLIFFNPADDLDYVGPTPALLKVRSTLPSAPLQWRCLLVVTFTLPEHPAGDRDPLRVAFKIAERLLFTA